MLDADEGQYLIRDGRQKASEADASGPPPPTWKYTGIAGLELGATVQYQQDLYQGKYSQDVDAGALPAHVAWRTGPFGLRAGGGDLGHRRRYQYHQGGPIPRRAGISSPPGCC